MQTEKGGNNPKKISFDKVVIWGHKLHSHTHSYVHNAFYRAFQYLNYPTYWFDDQYDVEGFDFSKSLFITEGQVDGKIPLLADCFYLLHNTTSEKYQLLPLHNCLQFQVYTHDVLTRPSCTQLAPCIYFDFSGRCLYMPWATDLLPNEIEQVKKHISIPVEKKSVCWIGTIGDGIFGNVEQLNPFMRACQENGISFIHRTNVSMEENQKLIESSYLAPAIVGQWQKEKGYVPCRIFKNISYGHMGVTNSEVVYELFERKIVYNSDTYQLFYDAKTKLENLQQEELLALMDFVKDKHTYINRIRLLLWSLEQVYANCGT